jgi:hypothetical protein
MSQENETKKKKKGNFLSNLFFESSSEETVDTNDTAEVPAEDITVTNSAGSVDASLAGSLDIPSTGDGVFDENFNKVLLQIIADNDIPGVDYYEFQKAVKQMNNGGMNESMLFQTVYNSLKIADPTLTAEKLLSSVDHYVSKLREEEANFEVEMQSSINSEVTSKRNEALALNDKNKEILAQIEALNKEMSENSKKGLELNNEADLAHNKITQTHKNFAVTLNKVVSGLESDKNKISQLIKD